MAFIGGLLVLPPQTFRTVVGVVLIVAAGLTIRRSNHDLVGARPVRLPLAAAIGGGVGLASGLTGVGGGVFLALLLLVGGWATPEQTVGLSAPFILANSAVAFPATRLAGQTVADGTPIYAIGSLVGAAVGTAIGLRLVSPRMIRVVLAPLRFLASRLSARRVSAHRR